MPYRPREPAFSEFKQAKRLSFPVEIAYPECGYLECKLNWFEVADLLGPPMLTSWLDGLGMFDAWAYEFPCGLKMAFMFFHEPNARGGILLDSPELEHGLRHLPFQEGDATPMNGEGLTWVLDQIIKHYPHRRAEIESLHAFQVWRIDDNGNVFTVGEPTSERDARCLVQQYEARGHKQMYWVAPVK